MSSSGTRCDTTLQIKDHEQLCKAAEWINGDAQFGVKLAATDVLVEDLLPVQVNRRLSVTDKAHSLLHERTNVEPVGEGAVGSNEPDAAHLAHGDDHLVRGLGHIGLEHERLLRLVEQRLGLVEGAAVDGDIEAVGHELENLGGHVRGLLEVDDLDPELLACPL
jgi:hypothetical protein